MIADRLEKYLPYSILAVTLSIGVMRFFIEPRLDLPTATGSYEALAHLQVGFLIGLSSKGDRTYIWQAVGLTALEVVMFAIQKNA